MRRLRIGTAARPGGPGSRLRRGRSILFAAAAATIVAGLATPAAAGSPGLRVVDLGTLGDLCCSQATALNNRGDVVGDSDVGPAGSGRHAFLWRDGRMVDLGTLGGTNSTATDINDRGDIAGSSDLASGATHAVLWRGGRIIDLGTLGGDASYATAVSDAGEVVGYSTTDQGTFGLHAFSWRGGVMSDLGMLNDGFARAYDVNNRGQVVGDSAVDGINSVPVRWQRGTPVGLTTRYGQASAINDTGQITGFFFDGTGSFRWSAGRLVDLGTLPGAMVVQSTGINNRGDVVGHADFDAFLWQRGQMIALPRLAGSTTGASDINDRGQVVGFSATSPDGLNPHAVLWTR